MSPLVDYESSSDDEPTPATSSAGALPPLPTNFHQLYSTNARMSTSDDPSLHGGRKRQNPHVEGQWPSHVYLEWHPSAKEASALTDVVDEVKGSFGGLRTLLLSDLSVPLPLHISLSQSLQIPTEKKEAFLDAITQAIRSTRVQVLEVSFSGLIWAPNFDRSRWFLALAAARQENDALNLLLRACNKAAVDQGYGALYSRNAERPLGTDASEESALEDFSKCFHFSIAWSLSSPGDASEVQDGLNKIWEMAKFKALRSITVPFDRVLVKMGNQIHAVDFGSGASTARKPSLG